MKLSVLLLLAAAVLPLSAENLLQNPGFEAERRMPWQSWPGPCSIGTQDPASGAQCMDVPALADKTEYLLQKGIPAEPGFAYVCTLKSRADDVTSPLIVHLIFRDAAGAVTNGSRIITCDPSADWMKSRGAGVAAESAATVDVSIEVPPGSGTFHIDDVTLEKGGRILGEHGTARIERTETGLRLVSPFYTLDFTEKRNYNLAGAVFGGRKLLRHFFFSVPEEKTKTPPGIGGSCVVTGLEVKERDGRFSFLVEECFPRMKVKRILEFYDGEPYIKFACEVKALNDFSCRQAALNFGFSGSVIARGRESTVTYTKWSRPGCWFTLDRPDAPRVLSFLDGNGKNGIALIGLNKTSWEELPGKMLSNTSGMTGDGFGIELTKWSRREIRTGDRVAWEVLVSPVENHEKAVELADRICIAD